MNSVFQSRNHLTVKIQHFGNLIVLDESYTIVGLSEFAAQKADVYDVHLLGKNFVEAFGNAFADSMPKLERTLRQLRSNVHARQIVPIKIFDDRFYFKFSFHDGLYYIEWEKQRKKYISAKKINEFNFLLDTIQPNNWDRVCQALNKLLNYDRVFVLQIQDTGYSEVIAEHTADGRPYFKGKEFSKDFMPQEIIAYYRRYPYSYLPNIKDVKQDFFYTSDTIETVSSVLVPIPELHRLFLEKIHIKSALFFRICVNNVFWGLAIAQNGQEKEIDLQQRKLCSFAVQAATNKYESHVKQNLLDRTELLTLAEAELKKSLSENMTVNCALVQHMDILTELVHADGLAIFNQGDILTFGQTPSQGLFYKIISFLQQHTDKIVFKDYNFRLNHQRNFIEKLNFAGLMYLKVGLENDYYVVWFRKETQSQVMQLSVNHNELGQEGNLMMWEETRYDVAKPWNDAEINFVERLNQIVKDSIFKKLKERQLVNEELLSLNNELEMFTYTLSHDLKNPLSILKMGIQFLQQHSDDVDLSKINKWYQNFSRSVSNIEDIINNMVHLSQHRSNELDKEPLAMSYTIQRIFQENSILYHTAKCKPLYGKLLPIWGEKSAVYQIFTNLIVNAIKYSAQSADPVIIIDSKSHDNLIHYSIKDNGIGIPKDNLPRIYEMFTRAENVAGIPGTGIGLSLVKRIMERLGGHIDIESEVGIGTTVHLYFPIVKPFPKHMLEG